MAENPIVVEFLGSLGEKSVKEYFLGTLEGILRDTESGTSFGWTNYTSHRIVPTEEVVQLNLRGYQNALKAIRAGGQPYWYLERRDIK